MRPHREERVESIVAEVISGILLREMEFSALVTVTSAELAKDGIHARVKVSVYPLEKEKDVMRVLGKSRNYLQHCFEEKVHMKPMPQIMFAIDRGPEEAAHVEKILMEDTMGGKEKEAT